MTNELSVVLATDCGSTTTKAVLFERRDDGWHQTFRGEAPTTVEKPVADVTIGAVNAFLEVQELSGRAIVDPDKLDRGECPIIIRDPEKDPGRGVDLYVSTSSAGGGLQMIVAGVVSSMTTESAERAALGAGAIVMDAISIDDGREPYERVRKIRHLRPDIVLIAGGTEGGTVDHPLELAETILQAEPRPRFGETLRLPVIYAANSSAADQARHILESRFEFVQVDNLRPQLERENLGPARDAIHELFLHHVMSHAPGYGKLLEWTPDPIIPTPAAVGEMVLNVATQTGQQILAVDIGGATTDVFSVFFAEKESEPGTREPIFNRTVSANLGMSYSIANVMLESGEEGIRRWIPFNTDLKELRDRLRNKMIRPTTIPFSQDDLIVEQAVCREALRLAFEHHKRLAVGLKGGKKQRSIGDMFRPAKTTSLVDMFALDLIIGSGGVLSHAPDRTSAALMMLDAYEPLGVTMLAVDSIFMMPHLGVLGRRNAAAASQIFFRDCLVPLGSSISPLAKLAAGRELCRIELADGTKTVLRSGELRRLEYQAGAEIGAEIVPLDRSVDVGSGPGNSRKAQLFGGHAGIILDGRGRPLDLPADDKERQALLTGWYNALGLPVPS